MKIVLTMAGKYERFKLFGNKVPKYLMPLGKSTVIWHVIDKLHKSNRNLEFFLLANENDRDFQPILRSIMNDFEIHSENLAYINDTASQLETASQVFEAFESLEHIANEPICFGNIDTILGGRDKFFSRLSNVSPDSGLLDVFPGSSMEYSYILPDKSGLVMDIADKHRLSEFACSGLYGFGSTDFFRSICSEHLSSGNTGNFTSLYKYLLNEDYQVFYELEKNLLNTTVLGTPEEYIVNLHKFG